MLLVLAPGASKPGGGLTWGASYRAGRGCGAQPARCLLPRVQRAAEPDRAAGDRDAA